MILHFLGVAGQITPACLDIVLHIEQGRRRAEDQLRVGQQLGRWPGRLRDRRGDRERHPHRQQVRVCQVIGPQDALGTDAELSGDPVKRITRLNHIGFLGGPQHGGIAGHVRRRLKICDALGERRGQQIEDRMWGRRRNLLRHGIARDRDFADPGLGQPSGGRARSGACRQDGTQPNGKRKHAPATGCPPSRWFVDLRHTRHGGGPAARSNPAVRSPPGQQDACQAASATPDECQRQRLPIVTCARAVRVAMPAMTPGLCGRDGRDASCRRKQG